MPRKVRVEYEGALYHLMSRGDRREPIFKGDKDRELFLETLGEACARTGWVVYSYVLMRNHYHLLVFTPEANLVRGMKWLQGAYTQRFNIRHTFCGHLFQGRYRALLVDPEEPEYARVVSDYIHLNPARAGLEVVREKGLEGYRWSSQTRWQARVAIGRGSDVVASMGLAETCREKTVRHLHGSKGAGDPYGIWGRTRCGGSLQET